MLSKRVEILGICYDVRYTLTADEPQSASKVEELEVYIGADDLTDRLNEHEIESIKEAIYYD